MKLHTLGTSSGTQPFAGFHHTCHAIETEHGLYFLDAGECGAYTAHLCGIDLLKTKAIFLSHPHMDHVGGLGNLLWYIRKIGFVRKASLTEKDNIDIFTPNLGTVDGVFQILRNTEGDFVTAHTHTVHAIHEGELFDNGDLRVEAVGTHHMPFKDGVPQSFAFRLYAQGKTIVYSGDMRAEDIPAILPEHCDVFLTETGHHQIEDITQGIRDAAKQVDRLFFVHHGGYIMRDVPAALERAKQSFGENVVITQDGMTYEI